MSSDPAAWQQALVSAEAMGLTREQVQEIADAWQKTAFSLTPGTLGRLVVQRANGLPWRPHGEATPDA